MLLSRCLSKRYRTIINSSSSCSSSIQCNIPKLSTCFKKFHSSNKKDSKREFDADELLHRSSIPTDHFQRSLPRLPIPKLHDTCSRYSQSVQPLIPQHKQHFSVDKTVQSLQEYHNELVQLDKSNKQTSYISGPWYDMYLKYRPALVFNHNPFVVFNPDPRKLYNTQIVRATNMIVSAMKFMKTYRAGLLEPEVFHLNPKKSDTQSFRNFVKYLPQAVSWYGAYWYKAFPLDMSQFPRLFNSTRIPRLVKDELLTDETARHIAVQRKGHIYIFDVINEDGRIAPPGDIMANIQYILNDDIGECEHPIGALTSEHRDTWAQLRESLVNNGNEEALRLVDTAVFMLSLDDYSPKHETDVKGMSSQFLHGRASNRWYDKSFSLLFAADGTASVNFEHSWGDGVAVLRFFNEVFKDTTSNPSVHPDSKPSSIDSSQSVRRIKFQLNDEVKSGIKTALEKFDQKVKTLDLDYFVMDAFGSKYLKSKKISPDAFMQLAFQMAYHKQSNGRTVEILVKCLIQPRLKLLRKRWKILSDNVPINIMN
ncbi:carnitine O-palmitoyltransferase 2, mitochondrial-like isoform X2 [Tubulanus polymorphus]|uniref:carnitine O-palmitoyltransferase 2, mitochondrial-like isoform X2 n=1 Tax=Tubulanus polymorphus TaxID=672921 RepID=UPI003DA3B3C7